MKIYLLLIAVSNVFFSCNHSTNSRTELKNYADSAAYAIGTEMGSNITKNLPTAPGGKNLDQQIILAAFADAVNGKTLQIPEDKLSAITQGYFRKMQNIENEKNNESGKKFLEENSKRAGIKTTASGLQYEIIKEGKGPKPTSTDTVKVDYHGTTIEGKIVESSVNRKAPVKFAVNQVFPGWSEALQLMPVGSKWKIFIPAALGYGDRGAGSAVKPNTVLIYEVELLEIIK